MKNGYFDFSFIVPKDINYAFGNGRVSYYAKDSLVDASGSFNNLIIGGASSNIATDVNGPEISVVSESTDRSMAHKEHLPDL